MTATFSTEGRLPRGSHLESLEKSPNYKDGRFVNKIPAAEPEMFKSLTEWIKGGKKTVPDEPVSIIKRSRVDFANHPPNGLRITWINHPTSLVEIDGVRLLLDPVWSERGAIQPAATGALVAGA